MQRRGVRRVNSIYARPAATATSASQLLAEARQNGRSPASASGSGSVPTLTQTRANGPGKTDSELLLNIAEQMSFFTEGLAKAQRSCDVTQSLFFEKCEEQNQIIAAHRSASLAESRALSASLQQQFQHQAPAFSWKNKGNEANHKFNCGTLNKYIEIDTAIESEEWQSAKDYVKKGIKTTIL
jgi:hypothetical protein